MINTTWQKPPNTEPSSLPNLTYLPTTTSHDDTRPTGQTLHSTPLHSIHPSASPFIHPSIKTQARNQKQRHNPAPWSNDSFVRPRYDR
ncbi:hypothetical protein B9Z19DRAFT_1083480 [Tuber borchii]|uniref:Uncharacterized protein n=1 Tax=Tuber borchii TaxID=42251 RepID=A0A2T6ZTB0_TUBBO|nr:hypothetical protein B9Z19DRAFT_1083480 [Tuber borchii]